MMASWGFTPAKPLTGVLSGMALGFAQDGSPRHPLYMSGSIRLEDLLEYRP